jgi:uroporphyrinogen-III synthase
MLGTPDGGRVEWIDEWLPVGESESMAESFAAQLLASISTHGTLSRKRILLTSGEAEGTLAAGLHGRGATVSVVPMIRIEMLEESEVVRQLGRPSARSFDWVVFTSKNAVDAFFRATVGTQIVSGARVAAVGPSTAETLRKHGIEVDLRPKSFSGIALVDEFSGIDLEGKQVLFPHGNLALRTVPDGLAERGAKVEAVEVYRSVPATSLPSEIVSDITSGRFDLVVFQSPSALTALIGALREERDRLTGVAIACIGPTTARAARDAGLNVAVEPRESTTQSLIEAIESYFAGDRTPSRELIGAATTESGERQA